MSVTSQKAGLRLTVKQVTAELSKLLDFYVAEHAKSAPTEGSDAWWAWEHEGNRKCEAVHATIAILDGCPPDDVLVDASPVAADTGLSDEARLALKLRQLGVTR